MSNFENTLRDNMAGAADDLIYTEGYTPAEVDAYRLGATHAIEEAVGLHEVEVALATEHCETPHFDMDLLHGEVRTSFALEWEQGTRPSSDLRIVDETLGREVAIIDAMLDCE